MLKICLFNGLRLEYEQTLLNLPSAGSRSLLAFCATYPGHAHTRSRLAGLFWPDLPEAIARRRLSHALWEIGQTLPEPQGLSYLTRTTDAIGFAHRLPHRIDVADFERAWTRTQQAPTVDEARHHLRQAADLYTGDFMTGFYDDWVLVEQERLREIYLQVLQRLIDAEKATGHTDAALRAALSLLAADPLRETAYQEVMRLYQQMGRLQDARHLYEQCRVLLAAELGVEPAPETTALLNRSVTTPKSAQRDAPLFSGDDLPLVGRKHERETLLNLLDETMHGQGGVAFLAGEAGIGKSRLLHDLAESAAWRSMAVHWGHTQDMTPVAPYAPLTAALMDGLSPLRAQQLATLLDRLWINVAGRLLPPLSTWLPDVSLLPSMQPEQEHIRLLEGIVRVALALGEITPSLLILEDLHWADEATFDALVYLAQRLPDSRVLLVASFRPAHAQARPIVSAGLQAVERIGVRRCLTLAPLDQEETEEIVRRGLNLSEPAPLFTARLHRETGGNPLFVLESLRTLHAEGLLVRNEAGEWATPYDQETVDYAELPLSHEVNQAIVRRLERIDATERHLLEAAAVLGVEVSPMLLTQISGMGGREMLTALGGLIRHNLLRETATAYHFSHDKVRETVYREMTTEERRRLHLCAGEVLAAEANVAPATVAYHFEAGKEWISAVQWHWQASQEAANLHSYGIALSHLDRVEELSQHTQQITVAPFDLLSMRENVLALLGKRDRQRATLDKLAQLAGTEGQHVLAVHQRYGRFFNDIGDHIAAVTELEKGLCLARTRKDVHAEARILELLGKTLYWRGDLQAALTVLRQAVEHAQDIDALEVEAEAQVSITGILNDSSDHEGASVAGKRAIALYQRLQNPVGEADVLATLGAVAMEQGRLDDADDYFAQALPVIRSSGYRYAEARCLVNWGSIDYLCGRLGDALDRFQLGAQIFAQVRSERGLHFTNLNIAATIGAYVGLDEDAEMQTRQALIFFTEQTNSSAQAQALGVLGRFAHLRGELDLALARYTEALESLRAAPDPWVEAQAYQGRAMIFLNLGAWRSALRDLEAGARLCVQYSFSDLAPLFMALQGQALLAKGQSEEALATTTNATVGCEIERYGATVIHFCHYQALAYRGDHGAALTALERAHLALQRIVSALAPADQARSRREIPEHRAILAAWETHCPIQQRVRLPRIDAPLGRPLTADEEVEVIWTIESAADRHLPSKTERRHQQIVRLLREAREQGARPAYHHLADALQVSERTIKRDMAALTQAGVELPPTRGA